MGLEDLFRRHNCAEEIQRLENIIAMQAQTILNLSKPHANQVKLVLINKLTNQTMSNATLASNQKIVGALGLVDATTNLPVTGSFSNTVATVDDTTVGTVVVNADQTITFTALKAGTCNLQVTTVAAFTDSTNTPQSQSLNSAAVITVTQVIVADQVSLVITFSAPVAQ